MNKILWMLLTLLLCISCTRTHRTILKNSIIYDENIEATIKGRIYGKQGEKQDFLSTVKVIPGQYYYISFNEILGIPLAYYIWNKQKWTYWTPTEKIEGEGDYIPSLNLDKISIHTLFSFLWSDPRYRSWIKVRTSEGNIEMTVEVDTLFYHGKVPQFISITLNSQKLLEIEVLKYQKK